MYILWISIPGVQQSLPDPRGQCYTAAPFRQQARP